MIKYYNRNTKSYEIEQVAGEKSIQWTYSTPSGKRCLEVFIKRRVLSKLAGCYLNTKHSKKKINNFIKKYNIDASSFLKKPNDFKSFNEFFTRRLKYEARPIDTDISTLISPCDGKLLAYENINYKNIFKIKGFEYNLTDLIKDNTIANKYNGGTCLIFRLCPTDYHRYHFIDNGMCDNINKILGHYYSVNNNVLQSLPDIFLRNKREWTIFHSDNFGDVMYIEVGATFVGSIIQTYVPSTRVYKGQEKGYFKFGGSTIMLLFKKDIVKIDDDIIQQTKLGYETKVLMGEKIGVLKL